MLAFGVRHCSRDQVSAAPASVGVMTGGSRRASTSYPPEVTFAVGQEEEPFPAVLCTGLGRAEYSARNAAPQSLQCRDRNGKLPGDIPDDVLSEEGASPAFVEHVDRPVEQPPVVVSAEPLSGDRVSLAGIARQDAIHCAAPCWSVEGSQIRPDSSRMKPPCRHARDQACGCRGFPLHESDAARVGSGNSDAEVEPSDAGAHTEGTKSHVTHPPFRRATGRAARPSAQR